MQSVRMPGGAQAPHLDQTPSPKGSSVALQSFAVHIAPLKAVGRTNHLQVRTAMTFLECPLEGIAGKPREAIGETCTLNGDLNRRPRTPPLPSPDDGVIAKGAARPVPADPAKSSDSCQTSTLVVRFA